MSKLLLDKQEVQRHIKAYQSGKRSMKAYCEAKGLSLSWFQYWYYKKGKGGHVAKDGASGFTEVAAVGPSIVELKPAVEVKLPNGTQINFNHSFSVELLKAFL